MNNDFFELCQSHGLTQSQAELLRKLIKINDGKATAAMIRGNFAISYGKAAALAEAVLLNSPDDQVEHMPKTTLLPPKERPYGWFGTKQ